MTGRVARQSHTDGYAPSSRLALHAARPKYWLSNLVTSPKGANPFTSYSKSADDSATLELRHEAVSALRLGLRFRWAASDELLQSQRPQRQH